MLDTNLLLDFLSIQAKEDKGQRLTDSLRRSKALKDKYVKKAFTSHASDWNWLEFRDVVEKLTEEKKLIDYGYNVSEFSEGRKELPLTEEELAKVQAIVKELCSFSVVATKEIDLASLHRICALGFSTFDALLLMQAHRIDDCKYFVTRDKRLISGFKKKLVGILPSIRVLNPAEAMALLKAPRNP